MYTALNMSFKSQFKHTFTFAICLLTYQSVLVHYQKHFLHYINMTFGQITITLNTPNIIHIYNISIPSHTHLNTTNFHIHFTQKFHTHILHSLMPQFCQHSHEYTHLFKCLQGCRNLSFNIKVPYNLPNTIDRDSLI